MMVCLMEILLGLYYMQLQQMVIIVAVLCGSCGSWLLATGLLIH
jgi:hypothetical protein